MRPVVMERCRRSHQLLCSFPSIQHGGAGGNPRLLGGGDTCLCTEASCVGKPVWIL